MSLSEICNTVGETSDIDSCTDRQEREKRMCEAKLNKEERKKGPGCLVSARRVRSDLSKQIGELPLV